MIKTIWETYGKKKKKKERNYLAKNILNIYIHIFYLKKKNFALIFFSCRLGWPCPCQYPPVPFLIQTEEQDKMNQDLKYPPKNE
jgi:hypothetical protein